MPTWFGKKKKKGEDGAASEAASSPRFGSPEDVTSPGSRSVTFVGDPGDGAEEDEAERKQRLADHDALSRLGAVTRDYSRRRTLERYLTQIPKHLFLRRVDLKVACCTWNVAEAKPHKVGSMEKWLQVKRGVDLIAVGLQEVDMGMAAMAGSGAKADPWVDYINRQVLPYGFRKVAWESMVGLVTVIFVKSRLAAEVRNVQTQSVKLGTGGVVGNKGALGVQFTMLCKRWLFVNSHFISDVENKEKRNENYHYVLNSLTKSLSQPAEQGEDPCTNLVTFGVSGEPGAGRGPAAGAGGGAWFGSASPKHGVAATISNSLLGYTDYVLWLGDLNYRIETPYEEAMQMIAQQRWGALIQGDQLTTEREAGRTFNDFFEAPVLFAPSYKYIRKQEVYDTSKKGGTRRVPAYTDRVLWYTLQHSRPDDFLPGSNLVASVKYKVYPDQGNKLSDHRPVALLLSVAVYQPEPQSVERVADMAGLGMPPQQTIAKLAEELQRPADQEQELYHRITPPTCPPSGPGTCFSSEDEGEGDEVRQRKDIDKRLGRVEELLRKGPLPGDGALRQIQVGQDVMQQKVDRLKGDIEELRQLGRDAGLPGEELGLLGETLTNVLDRMQAVEGLLAGGALGSGAANRGMLAAVGRLRTQHGELEQKLELFSKAVGAALSGEDVSPEELAPRDYLPEDEVGDEERARRADLRQAFLAGFAAGVSSCRHTRRLSEDEERAQAEALRQRQSALQRREEELRLLLQQREQDLSGREEQLAGREAEAAQRSKALQQLQAQIDERMAAIEALGGTEAAEANLSRREDALAEQELRLMRQRAKLSEQQLRLKQELADVEAHRDGFSDALAHREALLGLRERDLRHWAEDHAPPWPPQSPAPALAPPPEDPARSPPRHRRSALLQDCDTSTPPRSPPRGSPLRSPRGGRRRAAPAPRPAPEPPEWVGVLDPVPRSRSPPRQREERRRGGERAALREEERRPLPRHLAGPDPTSNFYADPAHYPQPQRHPLGASPQRRSPSPLPREPPAPADTPPPYGRCGARRTESPRRLGRHSPALVRGSWSPGDPPVWADDSGAPPPPRRAQSQQHPGEEGPRRGHRRPPPEHGGDPLAAALRNLRRDAGMHWDKVPPNFARVGPSPEASGAVSYAFGTRQIVLRLMGERREPRVLVGGGWMPFTDFASKFGAVETRRLSRSPSTGRSR
eukprot:TRINITY_DN22310_c0_g1_i1.p1 TRINITY_DN22310_c0_g1~~TRINITY_DN22310_c0_g1_i1.p1  ORF type:complete len:1196 (+),score=424.95 TRINITY_DN22310_c0_g1_i1:137-3724(+)